MARLAIDSVMARALPGRLEATGVDVHLHPDAPAAGGSTVLDGLTSDGRWRTQFETGTSNGGLTAIPGGDRWRWESRLFGGAYDGASMRDRPVYGGLRVEEDPYGSAPRFGSAHLRLRDAVLERSTLCYPDSAFEPLAVGTVGLAGAVTEALHEPMTDPLDRYVEAHVHGGLRLEDVEALVLDPSFRGTGVEEAGRRTGLEVRWHPGYVLPSSRIPGLASYRGQEVAEAAAAVAAGGLLTPAVLGEARVASRFDPQTLKRVWHLLAAFGRLG